ncbi:MAG: hypothetical protein ACRBCK_02340 [Alphaproteobacteria bacterium]
MIKDMFSQNKDSALSQITHLDRPLHERLCEAGMFDTEEDVNQNFDYLVAYLKTWLNEQGFHREDAILDFLLEKKDGKFRKDGTTPSALHEISQAVYMISCAEDGLHIDDPAGVLGVIFSHDLGEDYNVNPQQLNDRLFIHGHQPDDGMKRLLHEFDKISMHYGGEPKPEYPNKHTYSVALRQTQNAGLAKLFDNLQNAATIIGGLSDQRAVDYNVKIQIQLSDYIANLSENYPSQREVYKTLEKAIGKVTNINRHDKHAEDLGKPLTIENKDLTAKGLKLPLGLDPYIVAARRVWDRHPELKVTNDLPEKYHERGLGSDNSDFDEYTLAT